MSLRNEKHKLVQPLQAIRRYCVECGGGSIKDVQECIETDCPFYDLRFGRKAKGKSPVKALRKFCVECMGGNIHWPKECHTMICWCWHYRTGKNPNRKGSAGVGKRFKGGLNA